MARVGNSIIKGIEVQEIITTLNRAYADEWLAYYQYFIEAKVVKGLMKDAAIAELVQHAADELRHATMVADRIIQLVELHFYIQRIGSNRPIVVMMHLMILMW